MKISDLFQVNFYGVKSDIPGTQIKIEQSQADRSKKEFHPVRIDMAKNGTCFQVTVGRLHFAETTSNNMRKKGKPNPAQKYFQLVVSQLYFTKNGFQFALNIQDGLPYIAIIKNRINYMDNWTLVFEILKYWTSQNVTSLIYPYKI